MHLCAGLMRTESGSIAAVDNLRAARLLQNAAAKRPRPSFCPRPGACGSGLTRSSARSATPSIRGEGKQGSRCGRPNKQCHITLCGMPKAVLMRWRCRRTRACRWQEERGRGLHAAMSAHTNLLRWRQCMAPKRQPILS